MRIENQEENQLNMDAIRRELLRSAFTDSVFGTMLLKYDETGEPLRFPPLVVAGFNILDFEIRMKQADWTHRYAESLKEVMRGEKEIKRLMEDLQTLAQAPEGNRVAYYLCSRWIPEEMYALPDFIQVIPNELKPSFESKENERKYQELKTALHKNVNYSPILGQLIKEVEGFKQIDIPPLVINGVDIVKLEHELRFGNSWKHKILKPQENEHEHLKFMRDGLKALSQDVVFGEKLANKFVTAFILDNNPVLSKALLHWNLHNLLSGKQLVKQEKQNNTGMETTQVNYDEKEFFRLRESLKYAGLKEVPDELIVGLLVKNQDKSVVKWNTKKGAISSDVDMHFNKTNGKQYLNGFAVALSENGKQFFRRYNRIEFGNTLTYTQTLNMAQGRAISRDWFDKDENGKIGERYFAAAMFDLNDKDDKGNPKIVKFQEFDAPALVARYPIDFSASDKAKEYFMEGMMRGNLTDCSLITESGLVPVKVHMNARENELVFQRDGNKVDVLVIGAVAIVRDIDLTAEKKNDLNNAKKTGQHTGTSKENKQGAGNKGASRSRKNKMA